jgi:hypothetical protein
VIALLHIILVLIIKFSLILNKLNLMIKTSMERLLLIVESGFIRVMHLAQFGEISENRCDS